MLAQASETAESALLLAGEGGSAAKKMGERDTDELVVVLSRRSTAGTVIGIECVCGKPDTFVANADMCLLAASAAALELKNINYSVT